MIFPILTVSIYRQNAGFYRYYSNNDLFLIAFM